MKFFVQGVGAVTTLGPTALETWNALCTGEKSTPRPFPNCLNERVYHYFPVPAKFVAEAARLPRVRRSGMISLFGAAASFNALADAKIKLDSIAAKRMAVIFAICSGGVNYTRRFYNDIVVSGANTASPLLFPETVYNAAASHVAALLGVNKESYTLVGDSSIGLSAIHFATQLLAIEPELDHCLVVGTEEAEWVVADAFGSWRMAAGPDDFEVFGQNRGTIFGEGAGAILVGRHGDLQIMRTTPGQSFFSRQDSLAVARDLLVSVAGEKALDLIIASANGTFTDEVESEVFRDFSAAVYAPKTAYGETLGASSVLGVVLASMALREQKLPGTICAGTKMATLNRSTRCLKASTALVGSVGFNQQVNYLVLALQG